MSKPTNDAMRKIALEAAQSSPFVTKFLTKEEHLRTARKNEWNLIVKEIKKLSEDLDHKEIKEQCLAQLQNDFNNYTNITKHIKNNGGWQIFGWPLHTNKMSQAEDPKACILTAAAQIINGNNFANILKGNIPEKYASPLEDIKIMGDNNSQATYLSGALATTITSLSECNLGQINLTFDDKDTVAWPDCSTFQKTENFKFNDNFSYKYDNHKIVYIHNDYAFGGNGPSKNITNPWAPYDCSAMVSVGDVRLSTIHQAAYYNNLVAKKLLPNWWEDKITKDMDTNYQIIKNKDITKLEAGSILFWRKAAGGGHTAIFLGIADGHVIVLECNRLMPKMEGIGLTARPVEFFKDSDKIKFGYFKVNLKEENKEKHEQKKILYFYDKTIKTKFNFTPKLSGSHKLKIT